jgi:crotonobetainyl-CoA:carnitine CoA-transferase CaiB-like acyl-CoA transferase
VSAASRAAATRPWRHTDGWSTCAAVTDDEFAALCGAVGHPEVARDPRFAQQASRLSHPDYPDVFQRVLQAAAEALTVGEMLERLTAAGVPAVAAVPVPALHEHPQVRANHSLRDVEHPVAGPLREARGATVFSGTPTGVGRPAPALGEHTDEILAELGYDPATIRTLRADGVIA